MIQEAMKRTAVYGLLEKQGANFVAMGDWQVVADFGSVEAEVAAAQTAVALADQSAMGKVTLQGVDAAEAIKTAFGVSDLAIGRGASVDALHIYRLRQDLYFVNSAVNGEAEVVAKLEAAAKTAGSLVTVNDMTNGRFQFQLIGKDSALLLGRLCGLDFHNAMFPHMAAQQSSVAKVRQTILRHDIGGLPTYRLIGAGSFGQYVWETVMEAGGNLGIQAMGLSAFAQLNS